MPGGWVVDVQVAIPGVAEFGLWQQAVTTTSASYSPKAGNGVYRFRARLRHATDPGASDWSPVAAVNVR